MLWTMILTIPVMTPFACQRADAAWTVAGGEKYRDVFPNPSFRTDRLLFIANTINIEPTCSMGVGVELVIGWVTIFTLRSHGLSDPASVHSYEATEYLMADPPSSCVRPVVFVDEVDWDGPCGLVTPKIALTPTADCGRRYLWHDNQPLPDVLEAVRMEEIEHHAKLVRLKRPRQARKSPRIRIDTFTACRLQYRAINKG